MVGGESLGLGRGSVRKEQGVLQANPQPAGRQLYQFRAMMSAPGVVRETAQFDSLSEGHDPLALDGIELGGIGLKRSSSAGCGHMMCRSPPLLGAVGRVCQRRLSGLSG